MLVGEIEENEEAPKWKKKCKHVCVTRSNPIDSLRLSHQVLLTGILTKK